MSKFKYSLTSFLKGNGNDQYNVIIDGDNFNVAVTFWCSPRPGKSRLSKKGAERLARELVNKLNKDDKGLLE